MTEKLFENDAYLWECEAVVTACEPCKNGFAVELDKTVFFPEGGGQLSDRGKLGRGCRYARGGRRRAYSALVR